MTLTQRPARLRPWLVWTAAIALLVVAGVVVRITPAEDIDVDPFIVTGALDQRLDARSIAVTVSDPRIAGTAVAGGWSAEGTWLVVDVAAEALVTEADAILDHAVLRVGGVEIGASERPASLKDALLNVGVPRAGSLAFELPEGLDDQPAVLELAGDDDTRLDVVVRIPLDLAAVPHGTRAELRATEWAAS
ncbi:hypothetical protein ACIQLJ_11330 [Microbacterium sp. NPDC091313]